MILNKVKVKCTRVQALRLCTGRTDHRGSRSMALPFMIMALEGVRGQCHPPAALYLRERPGTHCTGGRVGPRTCLDRCGKSRPQSGFDSRTVQPIASRYTDYATRPTKVSGDFRNSSHTQYHSSHSVNGPDYSVVIQYVFLLLQVFVKIKFKEL